MVGLWLTISVVLNVACGSGVTGTSAMQQRIEHREYKQRQQGGRDNARRSPRSPEGRCTSAPVPVLSAIGTKPRLATRAVISTGRQTHQGAFHHMAVSRSPCSCHRSRMNATITRPLSTATPGQGDKADACRNRQRHTPQPQ